MSSYKVQEMISMLDVTQEDVVLGKDQNHNCLVGMIAFKALIETRLDSYMDPRQSTSEKTYLTMTVFKSVQDAGGRFLLRNKQKPDKLKMLDMDGARLKIRDCFRDCVKQVRRKKQRPSILLLRIGISRKMFSERDSYADILQGVLNNSQVKLFLQRRSVSNKYTAAAVISPASPSPPNIAAEASTVPAFRPCCQKQTPCQERTCGAVVEPSTEEPGAIPSSDVMSAVADQRYYSPSSGSRGLVSISIYCKGGC